jgi:phosphate starvation-inducible protein PhoH/intein/homing endonuclease
VPVSDRQVLLQILGSQDENRKLMERELDIRLSLRDSLLVVTGSPAMVERAASLLAQLIAVAERGKGVSAADVTYLVRMMKAGEDVKDVEGLLTDTILVSERGKPIGPRTVGQKRYVEAIRRNDLVFGIGPAGTGKCAAGDTMVLTDWGLLPIATLGAGASPDTYLPIDLNVAGLNGVERASHVYNGGHSPTKKIRTRFGFEIEVTPEHPLLQLKSDGCLGWTPAAELRVGDYVAIQRGQRLWGRQTAIEFDDRPNGYRDHAKPIAIDQLDEDIAYLLGILVGDGCLTFKNRVILSSADPEILEHFQRMAERFGLHVFANGGDRIDDRIIASSQLYQLLLHLGMSDGAAATKRIPSAILRAPEHLVVAFLQGLFDTDGTVNRRDGYPQLTSVSKPLIDQVQLVLLNLGILSNKRRKWVRYQGKRRLYYQLEITGNDADLFYERVGFRLARKQTLRSERLRNTNVDVVPHLHQLVRSAIAAGTFPRQVHRALHDDKTGRRQPSYETLGDVVGLLEERALVTEASVALSALHAHRLFWAQIVGIEDGEADVYDLTVPGSQAFCANGFMNHNTYLAVAMAVAALKAKKVARIILTRPAVEAGERLGFLPGDLQEKVDPYLRPLYDALYEMLDGERAQKYLERRIIEVAPLAYMRGRTLNDSFIIMDEAQNTTTAQMKMFLTRMGFGSKVVVTGDVTQIDLPADRVSGLNAVREILAGVPGIEFIYLTDSDVVRHKLVQKIIQAYELYESKQNGSSDPEPPEDGTTSEGRPSAPPLSRSVGERSGVRAKEVPPDVQFLEEEPQQDALSSAVSQTSAQTDAVS